jgi:hypothetical protein
LSHGIAQLVLKSIRDEQVPHQGQLAFAEWDLSNGALRRRSHTVQRCLRLRRQRQHHRSRRGRPFNEYEH